jgi:hypothetical protein
VKNSFLKIWAIDRDQKTLYVGSKLDQLESKFFSWNKISLLHEFESLDAKMALDKLDDSTTLVPKD